MEPKNLIVEIYRYESGKMRAFCDLTLVTEIGEITLKGFRVLAGDSGGLWVAFPSSSYENAEGKTVRKPILEVSRALRKQIIDTIIEEYSKVSKDESKVF